MSQVPEMREEEAQLLMLRTLTLEPKGQATASDIKKIIATQKQRRWNDKDIQRVANRSNAPRWHQIVQNAFDRAYVDGHFYLAAFAKIVSPSPHKVLQVTAEGRIFVEGLTNFEHMMRGEGFELADYLDQSPVEGDSWMGLKRRLKEIGVIYKADDLLRSLRSREYAMKHKLEAEKADFHLQILTSLRKRCDPLHAKSIDAWMVGRNYIGKLANLESKRDSDFTKVFAAMPTQGVP